MAKNYPLICRCFSSYNAGYRGVSALPAPLTYIILEVCMADEALYKEIPLTQGKVTIVDVADFDWLNKYRWWASSSNMKGRNLLKYYAITKIGIDGKQKNVKMHRLIMN